MSGCHSWLDRMAKMPAERRKRIKEDADNLHRKYAFSEICRLNQCQMTENLNMSQPAYASFEKGGNLQVGTLQKIASALGGELPLQIKIIGKDLKIGVKDSP